MTAITRSVGGKGGKNRPIDVIIVQTLLNHHPQYTGQSFVKVDGLNSPALVVAITAFQKNHPDLKTADGRVDPRGSTLRKLNDIKGPRRSFLPKNFSSNNFNNLNINQFVELCSRQFGSKGKSHLARLVRELVKDPHINRLTWAAYMLATVKHETAHTYQPIEEYGKGKGHTYGKTISVTDPVTKRVFKNVYYGRGFVQLTWEENYEKFAKRLNQKSHNSIHYYPDLAMDFEVAYKILSIGMREGLFRSTKYKAAGATTKTANTLEKYLGSWLPDYHNARDIINGYNSKQEQLDYADRLTEYARSFEYLLRFCNGIPSGPIGQFYPVGSPRFSFK